MGRTQWLHGYMATISSRALSVQTTPWNLQTSLTSSSQQCFHRTEQSFSRRRSHLRLEGRSTWLLKIRRDARCKNIKNAYACLRQHQTSQKHIFRKLLNVFPNPKSGDCRHPESSPASPEELSSTAPPSCFAKDPSTEMLPPEWLKFSLT